MKTIILTINVFCFSLIAIGQDLAIITFDSLTIDYGIINKGDDGIRQFKFTNTGNVDLEITRVRSSCGCTIPKKPESTIAPGKSDIIEVKYDTDRVGPIRKTITVTSNASSSIVALKIKGEVIEPTKEEID